MESQTEKEVLQEKRRNWLKKPHHQKRVPSSIRRKTEVMCVKCGNTWAFDTVDDLSCPHCEENRR